MTELQSLAYKMYDRVKDKEAISREFLYNAICYFELSPESVVDLLNDLQEEQCKCLGKALAQAWEQTIKIHSDALSGEASMERFKDPEILEIIFYEISHGYPIE